MSSASKPARRRSPRVQQKRDQARRDIQRAAQDILQEGGAEAVTLASVAGALGMTKPALYHYFPSKEALIRGLVTSLIDDEVEALVAAIEAQASAEKTLGTLIRAFYAHYRHRLDAFRTVYCQPQLYSGPSVGMDEETVRDEINPRTRHLFDILERRLAGKSMSKSRRARLRRLAFTAWTSALGLLTMLSIGDALDDPLLHTDEDLLDTLARVFDKTTKS
jgi:AcrR family transcriptional regulator